MRLGVDRGSGSRSSRSNSSSSSSSSRRRRSSSSGSSSSRSRSRSRRSPRCRPRRRRRSSRSRSRSRSRSSSNAAEVVVAEAEPPATIAVGVACYRFPPPPDVQREQHCVTDSKPTGNSADLRSWRSWLASVCSLDLSGFRWVWLLRGRCLGFRTLIFVGPSALVGPRAGMSLLSSARLTPHNVYPVYPLQAPKLQTLSHAKSSNREPQTLHSQTLNPRTDTHKTPMLNPLKPTTFNLER